MADRIVARMSETRGKGYFIIEWRTKPDATPMPYGKGPLPLVLTTEWVQFPVECKDLVALMEANRNAGVLIPHIRDLDAEPARKAGLMTRAVAEAVLACAKTQFLDSLHGMLDSLEWRLIECSWKSSYEAERLPVPKDELGAVASTASA